MVLPPKFRRLAVLRELIVTAHVGIVARAPQDVKASNAGNSSVSTQRLGLLAPLGLGVNHNAIIWTLALLSTGGIPTPDTPLTFISLDRVAGGLSGGQVAVFNSLRRRATAQGLPVYLVGGPVRDAVLSVPANDLDFVLIGDAPALAAEVAEELACKVIVHPRFGTATIDIEDDRVDVVTARKESYPSPGSLPEVSASSLEDDLARRDFSVNAMALPLVGDSPEVIDPHGGLSDIANRTIRTMYSDSFTDDPTRMFRAIRYEQRLGFQISSDTVSDLRRTIVSGYADVVSGDRWRQEFQKIFGESQAFKMLIRAIGLGVLAAVHPALCDSRPLAILAGENGLDASDYLAALAIPLSPADGEQVSRRLNLPADWARVLRDTIVLQEISPLISGPSVKVSAVCSALEGLDDNAIAASARLSLEPQFAARLGRYLDVWKQVRPRLTGDDLLTMGVPAGSMVGEILRELLSAKLDGLVGNEEGERALVNQIISRGS